MGLFSQLFPKKVKDEANVVVDDVLLQALLQNEPITRDKALTLPVVSSAVDFIAGTIAAMPVKLYKRRKTVTEVTDDRRTAILNGDSGDTLTGVQIKKNLVEDYLLGKGGYAYIERDEILKPVNLYYIQNNNVSIMKNTDPIFKEVGFSVNGKQYRDWELLKLLRNSKDGASGVGLTNEIAKSLEAAYQTLLYQMQVVKRGGNKKGFLKSKKPLDQKSVDALKAAWRQLYANGNESVAVLNDGIEFQESSNSSVEMQLNESKKTFRDEINSVFHIHENDFYQTFKEAIYPIIKVFEAELNSVFLSETEKRYMFFEFDVKEILRANIKERYDAYHQALIDGWSTVNEIRREENRNDIEGMDVLNLGLSAVLYDTESQVFFTPNTGQIVKRGDDGEILEPDTEQS